MIKFTGPDFVSETTSLKLYSDGTPMVKTDEFEAIVAKATSATVIAQSLLDFTTAMFLLDAVNWKGGSVSNLVLPYIPGARQDRINVGGDVLYTARSVANMINMRGFNKVVVLDPHSPVISGLISGTVEYPLERVYNSLSAENYDGVIAPDHGGVGRASQAAAALGLPLFKGGKSRDVSTGKITGFTLETLYTEPFYVQDGHYLVVDDICDGGGTFNGLASKIQEQGATADLYVSHGIFSKGLHELLMGYEQVITTNSMYQRNIGRFGFTVLPVVQDMENYRG